MAQEFFAAQRPQHGLRYAEYTQLMESKAAQSDEDAESPSRRRYTELNLKRSRRIRKSFQPSEALRAAMQAISQPQLWMVITEPWCGDSAQCLPQIEGIAAASASVELRIILRDSNLDIMDLYLTNGKRGIPKLVAFAADGRELFAWGPRPQAAQQLFDDSLAAGHSNRERYEALHLWYARNRGADLDREFRMLLASHH